MINALFANLFGTSIFIGLMYAVWKANARRWNRLARVYQLSSKPSPPESDVMRMQTVILTGRDIGWNSYKGITTVAVTSDGILFQIMPVFSAFHKPLLIPFGEISVAPKKWYLFGKSFQLSFSGVDDVQMIVHSELMEWVEKRTQKLAAAVSERSAQELSPVQISETLQSV